ncbi:MAG: hypothetical protein ACI9H8_001333 [Lysobacterales bacterium]|jgi:hypothetical protein
MKRQFYLLLVCLLPMVCYAQAIEVELLPSLPEPVSNNAVSLIKSKEGVTLFSFQGLASGKTQNGIHNKVWALKPDAPRWEEQKAVPAEKGRLAGVAVSAGGMAWLFGGYTVALDGSEKSTPEVFKLQDNGQLEQVSSMPVPVDDMTAFVYRDRYIYLTSGWHDLGNVNLVQVLDIQTMSWAQATPYPGEAVFGHAGGMFEDRMLVCDGVRIEYSDDGSPWIAFCR